MKNRKELRSVAMFALALSLSSAFVLFGCGAAQAASGQTITQTLTQSADETAAAEEGSLLDQLFTARDLEQEPDLDEAVTLAVSDGKTLTITEAGVYRVQGSARNASIVVDAADDAKVQLVLDGVSIVNCDFPAIYVKSADKVFVTTISDSSLSVTGSFTQDGDTNTDGVIFSKDDLTLNGTAKLSISSGDNGVVSKDDLKVTGGSYEITASSKCFEANDSIRISGGSFALKAGTDALHAENEEDQSLGNIYILGGEFTIVAGDDGVHANGLLQIEDGSLNIQASEGLEATYVLVNGGSVTISASDDGINAARKSNAYTPTVEINGGEISISMGTGDTDGIDSNGNVIITGGTVSVTGSSAFDYDGTASFTGGTVYVNGQQVSTLPNQMMGGGMGGMGGFGGGQGGGPGMGGGFGGGRGGWGH